MGGREIPVALPTFEDLLAFVRIVRIRRWTGIFFVPRGVSEDSLVWIERRS